MFVAEMEIGEMNNNNLSRDLIRSDNRRHEVREKEYIIGTSYDSADEAEEFAYPGEIVRAGRLLPITAFPEAMAQRRLE